MITEEVENKEKQIQDKSIDLIFTDPPYNIGKDFGNNKDQWKTVNEYIIWCKKWIDECFRILKDDGSFYFMTATQHMPYLDAYVQEKYHVISRIIWTYDSSGVQSKKSFGSLYEPILMCCKTSKAKYTFNSNDILVDAPTGSKRKLIDYRKTPPAPYSEKKIPGNVWHFNRVRFLMDEYENHPTQKPVELLKRIILASSNEGDIVFDPFSGSFTTSFVGKELKRKTIGVDLNEEYFLMGLRRTNICEEYDGKIINKVKIDNPDVYQKLFEDSDLLRYIDLKTGAIYGNSKTRKSLGNIYAIYALLDAYAKDFYQKPEEYKKFQGYEYTSLLEFCRNQYGGEKIQNHALNSRLNSEFDNKVARGSNKGKNIVVQNGGKYMMHIDYIYVDGIDMSKTIIKMIEEYITLLRKKDDELISSLEELTKISDLSLMRTKIENLIKDDSEARVFEIISYAILKNYYKSTKIYFGYSRDELEEEYLTLYKTGRTNANDGGIDFVMRPLGRFFQVTEVGNYDKYFLDIDKVLHFPITFVIKTNKSKETVKNELNEYIKERSGGIEIIVDRYNKAIEEIITINELKEIYRKLKDDDIKEILSDIVKYYKIEMNFNDFDEE